jgi:hypothetical protein
LNVWEFAVQFGPPFFNHVSCGIQPHSFTDHITK